MTKGSVEDAAVINADGSFGKDLVNDMEFLLNHWTATGGSSDVTVDVVKEAADECILNVNSTYLGAGKANPLNVVSTYTLKDGSDIVLLKTVVSNPGPDTYTDMFSGYSLSTFGGNMFGPFGFSPYAKITDIKIGTLAEEPYGDFAVTYSDDYAVSIQMDNSEYHKGSAGYRDLYQKYTLEPGASREFTGEMQIEGSGATVPYIERAVARTNVASGTLSGTVQSISGKDVTDPVIVIRRVGRYIDKSGNLHADMQTFAWGKGDADGKFSFTLPTGDYEIYADCPGYARSVTQSVSIASGDSKVVDFSGDNGLQASCAVSFIVKDENTNKAIDARVEIKGATPDVAYLGASTFFTGINPKGKVTINLAPGSYEFTIKSGAGFETKAVTIARTLEEGGKLEETVKIATLADPTASKWYCADMHHHSDIGDGATDVESLILSQAASRLDLSFLSDHDSVANNAKAGKIAKKKNIPFLPSLEVSPGWGHFNILTMPEKKAQIIDPTLTADEIFDAAHEMKALVAVNHPYSDYGYFYNKDVAPGGFDMDFDFIELQPPLDLASASSWEKKTLDDVMDYWTAALDGGKKYYLTGGTDTHDVTSTSLYSGVIREYAKLTRKPTVDTFMKALQRGKTYVTMGPLIYTKDANFGDTCIIKAGDQFKFDFDAEAVDGLKEVKIYSNGELADSKSFDNVSGLQSLSFAFTPEQDAWYNIIATDADGSNAVSNPVWVDVRE